MENIMNRDPAGQDLLILVDGLDRETGSATKAEVHLAGLLHRAFSVVLIREGEKGPELLLSRRAPGKYHSAGLWANACCSHPRPGETVMAAAIRRVREELGVEIGDMRELGSFIYRAPFENGLTEYEYDHVLLGTFSGVLHADPEEIDAVKWVPAEQLAEELRKTPSAFAAWAFTVLGLALKALDQEM